MKNTEETEFKQGKGEKIEITMKLSAKRFDKCSLFLREGEDERNSLKIIAAKKSKLSCYT